MTGDGQSLFSSLLAFTPNCRKGRQQIADGPFAHARYAVQAESALAQADECRQESHRGSRIGQEQFGLVGGHEGASVPQPLHTVIEGSGRSQAVEI